MVLPTVGAQEALRAVGGWLLPGGANIAHSLYARPARNTNQHRWHQRAVEWKPMANFSQLSSHKYTAAQANSQKQECR